MRSVVDRNVVMRRILVFLCKRHEGHGEATIVSIYLSRHSKNAFEYKSTISGVFY